MAKEINLDSFADKIADRLLAAKQQAGEAGEGVGEEFVQGVVKGIQKHSKDAKSEVTKLFEEFNKVTNNFKSRKSISNAEWTRVLGLSKELMKSERYVDSIREKLSNISVTFRGTGKISGIDKILDEFEKGKEIETVLWSEAGKNYKKKKPTTRQPKVEVPVVSADPAPVVKAEKEKQGAISGTSEEVLVQADAIDKVGENAEKTKKKILNMESAVKRYNKLMSELGKGHLTIGTDRSEDTEGWGIKEMVEEAKYQLGTYYDSGQSQYFGMDGLTVDVRKRMTSEVGKLKRFIATYEPYVDMVENTEPAAKSAAKAAEKQTDALREQEKAASAVVEAQQKVADVSSKSNHNGSVQPAIQSYKELKSILEECERLASQMEEHKTPEIINTVESMAFKPLNTNYLMDEDKYVSIITEAWNEYKKLEGSVESTDEALAKAEKTVTSLAVSYARAHKNLSAFNNEELEAFTRNKHSEYERAKDQEKYEWGLYGTKTKVNNELFNAMKVMRDKLLWNDKGSKIFPKDVHDQLLDAINQIILKGGKANDVLETMAKLMGLTADEASQATVVDTKDNVIKNNQRKIESYQDLLSVLQEYFSLTEKITRSKLDGTFVDEFEKNMPDYSASDLDDPTKRLVEIRAEFKKTYQMLSGMKRAYKDGIDFVDNDNMRIHHERLREEIDYTTTRLAAMARVYMDLGGNIGDFNKTQQKVVTPKLVRYDKDSDAFAAEAKELEKINAPIEAAQNQIRELLQSLLPVLSDTEKLTQLMTGRGEWGAFTNIISRLNANAGIDMIEPEYAAKKLAEIFGFEIPQAIEKAENAQAEFTAETEDAASAQNKLKESVKDTSKSQKDEQLSSVAKDSKTIGQQLLELENITGMTVTEVLSDYDSLNEGIKTKVNSILQSLGLMNDQMEFTFSKSRGGNAKAILGDGFVILQKAIESNEEYAESLIAKLQEAQKLGINVAPIMERVFSNVPDGSGFLSNNLYKPGYEIQKRAYGQDIHINQRAAGAKDLNKALEENRIILSATDEQLVKFIRDYIQLDQLGVKIDPNPFNFLYDAEKGFSFIDLSLKRTEEQAKSTQEVFRELATFLANIVGFNALGQDSELGLSSGQVIAKVADAFEKTGIASRSELDQWVKERYEGFGNIYDGYIGNANQNGDSGAEIQKLVAHINNLGEEFKDTQRCKELFDSLVDGIKSGSITAAQAIEKMSNAYEEANQTMVEYSTKAMELLSDESLPFEQRSSLFDELGKQVYSGSITLDGALERIRTFMDELRHQSADDTIDNFGADSENLEKFVAQLQKLSATDLTRIFDHVDLKEFLEAFNIDKSNFATFKTLFEELMQITKAMSDGVDVGNAFDLKMEEITDTIMRLGGHMTDLDDSGYATVMQDFYKHMSNIKIQFGDSIKAEYTKDQWKALYNTYKGRLTSDVTKGISADSLYEELAHKWPSLFPEDLDDKDRFKLIFEKLDEARRLQANNWKVLQGFVSSDRAGIQGSVDDIYSKMSNALYAEESADSVGLEADAFKDVEQSAEKAAKAKEKFDRANQKVKKGADASANSLDDEADGMARVVAATPPDSEGWDAVTQYKAGDNDEPNAIRRTRTVRADDSNRQITETLTLNENGEWETAGSTQTDNYRVVRQEELNALYKEREHCLTNILKYTKEIDNADTEAGRNAARDVLALEQERLDTINASIEAYGDLVSQQKLDAQDDKLVVKTRDHEQQRYIDMTEDERTEAANAALQRRQAILNNIAKLEKQRNGAVSEQEREAINAIIATEQERARIVAREIDLYESVNAAQKVQQQDAKVIEKSRQQQQQQTIADTKRAAKEQKRLNEEQTKSIEKKYDEYLSAQKNIQKFDLDLSGKDHTDSRANEYQKMVQAEKDLLDLGVDVKKISESDVLTLEQKEKLLEKEAKHRREIHDLIVSASDKERDMQKKDESKAASPYKTSYNKELEAFKKIEASVRSFGDDGVSSKLQEQIAGYKQLVDELGALNKQLDENPSLAKDEKFSKRYEDVAMRASKARVEIEGVFNGSQKLQKLGTLVKVGDKDVTKLGNLKVAMMEFANTTWDGEAKIAGFNKEETEMYVTLDRGAGAVENITVALDKASGRLNAFSSGTSKATNEWNQFKKQTADGVQRLATMYLSFHDLVRYGRKGVEAVKEIDLAMTELKKVTDETDASYKEFLKDASGTSAVIGSTISDFTEATATFARLGYSMEESSSMAETAIIYKNVADGLDSVEESSDSIISTMMAFGIEANDTMSIIDRFNAVGKMCADYKVA